MYKHPLGFAILILLTTLACALSPAGTETGTDDNRPVLQESRPAIVFLAPQTGNKYAAGSEILLHAEARDLGTGISKVEFYDNFDQVIGTVNAENPAGVPELTAIVTWQTNMAQIHFLKARAFRADGTQSNLQEISIEIVALDGVVPETTAELGATATTVDLAVTAEATTPNEVTPTATSATSEAPASGVSATVTAETLNVRVGATINSGIASSLTRGTKIELVGRSADSQWYVTPLADGSFGWVFGQLLAIEGDPSKLPLVDSQ